MPGPFIQRITASSYHICDADRKKLQEILGKVDASEFPIGGFRSVSNVMTVSCIANTPVQIVQADAFREALILYPPNDVTLIKAYIAWAADVNPLYDLVLNATEPLVLNRRRHGGLVTMPIWGYYQA